MIDNFDNKEFYELMQSYRHSKIGSQSKVVESFEEVKTFIRDEVEETSKNFALWIGSNYKKNKGKLVDELWSEFLKE